MAQGIALLVGRLVAGLLRAVALAVGVGALSGLAAAQELPWKGDAKHTGVASCAGPCHARQAAMGTVEGADMRGSEVAVWQQADTPRGRHSQAYNVLLGRRAQDMGRKLGYRPETAQACLVCHANPVDSSKRDARFQLSDGVSCETCHGGSEKWLPIHYEPASTPEERAARHQRNLANGLFPLENVADRARVCGACHIGSAAPNQFVTHQIMGAGHPRLSFELELFTSLQQHHVEDDLYRAAKPVTPRGNVWAMGQAVAARTNVVLFLQSEERRQSLFPELSFFDCHSCHRPISDNPAFQSTWRPNPLRPIGTGVVSFNDANTIVIGAAARALAGPRLAEDFEVKARAFQMSILRSAADRTAAGKALSETLSQLTGVFATADMTPQRAEATLREIVSRTQADRYTSYGSAEQAVMAIDSLSRAMGEGDGGLQARAGRLRPGIDAAYRAVTEPAKYDPDAFKAALADIAARLGA